MSRTQTLVRFVFGSRATIAGTVYGTIVVLAVLSAGGKTYRHNLWGLIAIVDVTVLVLWLAHVYAHGLGESLQVGRRLQRGELRAVARRELAIPLAAVVPTAALVLGAVGLLDARTAEWLAFWLGVATLAVQGVRYARVERLSRSGALIAVAVNVTLGLVLVLLEVIVSH